MRRGEARRGQVIYDRYDRHDLSCRPYAACTRTRVCQAEIEAKNDRLAKGAERAEIEAKKDRLAKEAASLSKNGLETVSC